MFFNKHKKKINKELKEIQDDVRINKTLGASYVCLPITSHNVDIIKNWCAQEGYKCEVDHINEEGIVFLSYWRMEMNKWTICLLFAMIWFHILDDFVMQSILAQMKQKKWWARNAPQTLYEHDYIAALIAHSLSWSFSITIPLLAAELLAPGTIWMSPLPIIYILNAFFHCFVDDLKCNKFQINLWQDQTIHLAQIILTWILLLF